MGIQATIIPVFTQPAAVMTGLLWKIPHNVALGLSTLHFALGVQLWVSQKIAQNRARLMWSFRGNTSLNRVQITSKHVKSEKRSVQLLVVC